MRHSAPWIGAVVIAMGWGHAGILSAADDLVVVVPKESDEILANPDMGWETFHNTADNDRNLPAWIPSTVQYIRWGWRELEPAQGVLNETLLDKTLHESHAAGQTLAFRVMCCSSSPRQPYHPSWLKEIGGKVVTTRYGQGPELEVPVLDDPVVLQAHLDFIKRLGARYDGHPDISHVDLGSVGWWGEWHMSQSSNAPMPTLATQQKVVDAYLSAFKKTPLLMLIGGGPMLKYATSHGTGWRADCLGDMGGFSRTWCHMRMAYPQAITQADALDTWQAAPVAWETCWDMRKWVDEGWSLRYIFNYALALHGSYINNKSAPLPAGADARDELKRFLRRLGYRLVLKELKHPKAVQRGEQLTLAMKWQNSGSAPCYKPFHLAYRLSDSSGTMHVLSSDVTVNHWLPGSIELFTPEFLQQPGKLPAGEIVEVPDQVQLPSDLTPGSYTLSVAVVDPATTKPVIQLAIQGRDAGGWYVLSKLNVTR